MTVERSKRRFLNPIVFITKCFKKPLLLSDLSYTPFHMISLLDDFTEQTDVFNELFLEVLNQHAPVKRVNIRSKPNPFITPEIRQLIRTRDQWRKLAGKTNDPLHWNG